VRGQGDVDGNVRGLARGRGPGRGVDANLGEVQPELPEAVGRELVERGAEAHRAQRERARVLAARERAAPEVVRLHERAAVLAGRVREVHVRRGRVVLVPGAGERDV